MENDQTQPEETPVEEEPVEEPANADGEDEEDGRGLSFWLVVAVGGSIGLCLLLFLFAMIIGLASGRWEDIGSIVAVIRDLFIILLVLEGILIGIALIVMILQLAALLNVLQNEIRPIIESSQQAVDTVRGTTQFVSKHVTRPVIRAKSFMAGSAVFVREVFGIRKVLRWGNGSQAINEETSDGDSSEQE